MQSNYQPIQDPIIRSESRTETIAQGIILGVAVALSYWLLGFEIALLIAVVFGFTLNTMNIMAGAISTNVQIAEVRNLLKERRRNQPD